jgi:hypothetical protein
MSQLRFAKDFSNLKIDTSGIHHHQLLYLVACPRYLLIEDNNSAMNYCVKSIRVKLEGSITTTVEMQELEWGRKYAVIDISCVDDAEFHKVTVEFEVKDAPTIRMDLDFRIVYLDCPEIKWA